MTKQQATAHRPIAELFPRSVALGGSVAEDEKELAAYFLDDERLVVRVKEGMPGLFIFLGPKGSGKSAVQRMIEEEATQIPAKVFTLRPADIALWTLAQAPTLAGDAFKTLDSRWLNKTLWSYLFVVELLRREYGDFPSAWLKLQTVFSKKKGQIARLIERGVTAGDTSSFSERFLEVVEELKVGGKVAGQGIELSYKGRESTADEAPTILNDLMAVTNRLGSLLHHHYLILIDDLDQNWTGNEQHILLLEALLAALQALSKAKSVSFVVALRDDIFKALHPDDPDKLRQSTIRLDWSQKRLKALVRERIKWATGSEASSADGFPEVFAEKTNLRHLWEVGGPNPRRVLQLLNAVIEECKRRGIARADEKLLRDVAEMHSQEFLGDLDTLFRFERPGLRFIAQSLRRIGNKQFDADQLTLFCADLLERLDSAPSDARGAVWAQGFINSPHTLGCELLRTGLLLYKSSRDSAPRPFVEGDQVDSRSFFAVNPTYALGLGLT